MILRRSDGEIAWSCDACGDDGVIHGWERSPADGSELDDSDAEGDVVTLVIARELFDVIRDVLCLTPPANCYSLGLRASLTAWS